MEIRSYNQELGICNLLFKRIFNNIRIQRKDKDGSEKEVLVDCQFGQRSRIYKSWQNSERKAQIKLPMIVINRTGYSRDTQRLNNLHNEVKYEILSTNRIYDLLTPVPIDINYEVTILSKYPSDIDQIASNFMVFFNSSVYVSCVHPKYEFIKMNNQIIMEDSVSEEHPDEFDGSLDDLVTSTFNFTLKSFLFGGLVQAKKSGTQSKKSGTTDDHSEDIYSDFTPIIKTLNIGFYPTPTISDHIENFEFVDATYSDELIPISGYISSTSYTSAYEEYYDEEGIKQKRLSALIPDDMIYEQVNQTRESHPYVDRVTKWVIDEN